MAKLSPSAGGCWFCSTDDETNDWHFSFEFDAYYHEHCLMKALEDKDDREAQAIYEEFKYEEK